MGRRSKLTEEQWAEIKKRLLNGESCRALAKEFGVSEAAIRQRLSSQVEEIKDVANQIVTAQTSLSKLPISSQVTAQTIAAKLMSVSSHLLSAADYGAATAHRLAGIAHNKVAEIDDATPLDENSLNALRGIAVLTKMANDSSVIGVNLLSANKGRAAEIDDNELDLGRTADLLSKIRGASQR